MAKPIPGGQCGQAGSFPSCLAPAMWEGHQLPLPSWRRRWRCWAQTSTELSPSGDNKLAMAGD